MKLNRGKFNTSNVIEVFTHILHIIILNTFICINFRIKINEIVDRAISLTGEYGLPDDLENNLYDSTTMSFNI